MVWYHSAPIDTVLKVIEPSLSHGTETVANGSAETKPKRKKLKGKRAVVRWLKFFRFKKKKDYERMTSEEKILFKLRKVNFVYGLYTHPNYKLFLQITNIIIIIIIRLEKRRNDWLKL